MEYYHSSNTREQNCAPITASSGQNNAMQGDTIHVSQKMSQGKMFFGFDLMLWTPKAYLPNQDGATDGDDLNNKRRKLLEPNSEVWTIPYTSHITSALLPHLTLTTTIIHTASVTH